MGDNINLERIKDAAKKMTKNLESQKEDIQNKNKSKEYENSIESMDKSEVVDELMKVKELYKQIKYGINSKTAEKRRLEEISEVRRYKLITSQLDDLEQEKMNISDKICLLEQSLCNHELLYLMTYPKRGLTYYPTYKCLSCGKTLNGFISENQVVINDKYIDEDELSYKGNIQEYIFTKYRYHELIDIGESEEEIIIELQDELHKKYKGVKKNIIILRKKEDE